MHGDCGFVWTWTKSLHSRICQVDLNFSSQKTHMDILKFIKAWIVKRSPLDTWDRYDRNSKAVTEQCGCNKHNKHHQLIHG